MIIVDTSVLVDLERGKQTPEVLELLEFERRGGQIGVPYVCVQEYLMGARGESEWRDLLSDIRSQHLIGPLEPVETRVEAARIFFDLRRRGLTIRGMNDCYIAALCLERDATLLARDRDFSVIAEVRPLRLFGGFVGVG